MRFAWILLGSILSTIVLFGIGFENDDLRLAMVVQLLIIVLVREHLSAQWWYRPFFLTWLGVTFLVANWLQLTFDRGSSPALVTFGPGFLIIALHEVVRQYSTQAANR